MIVRVAAALLDAWYALARAGKLAARAWLVLPGDLLGRIVLAGCGIRRETGRTVSVSVPGVADPVEAVVIEDRRAARYLDAVPVRPFAQTLGRHVVARGPLPPPTLRHELEHVRQWQRLGPLFLPAYLASSGLAVLRGQDAYWGNAFEAAARAREPEG